MLLGKKQRALERERNDYKAEVERLKKELDAEQARNKALLNPPEGCKVGNWCQGCKYADSHYIPGYGYERIRTCLYGACEKRDPVPPFPFPSTVPYSCG